VTSNEEQESVADLLHDAGVATAMDAAMLGWTC
jgi:hypothetical protein